MDINDLEKLLDAKLHTVYVEIRHLNKRLDSLVSNAKWVVIPAVTAVIIAIINATINMLQGGIGQ